LVGSRDPVVLPGFVEPEVPVGPLGVPLDEPRPLVLLVLSSGGAVPAWPRCWAAVPRFSGESLGGMLPLVSALPVLEDRVALPLPGIAPLAVAD